MKASQSNSSQYCSAVTALNLQSLLSFTARVFLQTVDAELRGDGWQKSH